MSHDLSSAMCVCAGCVCCLLGSVALCVRVPCLCLFILWCVGRVACLIVDCVWLTVAWCLFLCWLCFGVIQMRVLFVVCVLSMCHTISGLSFVVCCLLCNR